MTPETAAQIAHEVNRAYCHRLGDDSQKEWLDAPEWQRKSAITGIRFHWANLEKGIEPRPSASHESWLKEKTADGWKYGPVKDVDKKEHPCFVAYEKLPADQQTKDYLFSAVAATTWFLRHN